VTVTSYTRKNLLLEVFELRHSVRVSSSPLIPRISIYPELVSYLIFLDRFLVDPPLLFE